MKRLYSPWRSVYIKTFSEKGRKSCLFCRIKKEKKDRQNFVVWRGKHCYVVLNLFPYNSGHLMVVPYKHTKELGELSNEESAEVFGVSSRCMKALNAISAPHGYNLGANLGRVAGAGIEQHLHFHIVPRWNGDTNFMPVLADTKIISEELKGLWRKLKREMGRVDG
ncbi:MAG TPA: HIT domain-containing protein [Bacteroidota bacterium]|nr:HIT domain-containing protein [Bacteroidota bacterium]